MEWLMKKATLMVAFLLLLVLLVSLGEAKTYLDCGEKWSTKPNRGYRDNVNRVIGRMRKFTIKNADLVYRTYETGPEVYGMAFCSTDNKRKCGPCINSALRDIRKCGNVFSATGTRVDCKVRFDYFRFF